MSQLNIKGKRTNILLKTMSHDKSVPTYVVLGLQLPDMFPQKQMLITADNIPTNQDFARWPYLQKVDIPEIYSNI